ERWGHDKDARGPRSASRDSRDRLGGGAGPGGASNSPTQAAGGSASPTARACCTKVVAAYSNISADDWIPWYAFEKGIYKDNELDVDLQSINGGAQTSAALLAGGIQIGQFGGSE